MKKRTKKYKARDVIQNPLNFFLGGLKRIGGEHLTELNSKNHASILAITQGRATKEHFDQLTGMVNMALVLTEMHFNNEYLAMLYESHDALHALGQRYLKIGKFVFKAEELNSMNSAIEVHEAQLDVLRVIDVERAYDEIQRRLKYHINTKKIEATA